MTSYVIEKDHNAKLQQILYDHNLFEIFEDANLYQLSERTTCQVPKDTSTEISISSIYTGVGEAEEKHITLAEEYIGEEEVEEFIPFPSPSLIHPFSDETREVMKINRIHVLPENFPAIINLDLIPDVAQCGVKESIDMLAKLLDCKNFQHSMSEFWFLDTLTMLLWRAQNDSMDKQNQRSLILWFCEFIKEIQSFDAADRNRMLRRFKANALLLARRLPKVEILPVPTDLGITYKVTKIPSDPETTEVQEDTLSASHTAVSPDHFMCNLKNTLRIMHYIFDIFGTDYQYNLIRSVFTYTPDYKLINLPHKINLSRSLYTVKPGNKVKTKAKKESDKESKSQIDKCEGLSEDYIGLMLLKAKQQLEIAETEARENTAKEIAAHILPLSMAVDQNFFFKYWPNSPASKSSKRKK